MTKQLTQPKFRPNFLYRLMLFSKKDGKFKEERYYWTKWGLQRGMDKYKEEFTFNLWSGHIAWKLKLREERGTDGPVE